MKSTMKHTLISRYTIIILLFSLGCYSCFARGNITKYIDKNKTLLSENMIDPLQDIDLYDLRKSIDNKSGTLYYAGLLWFLNDNTNLAEIAWKRSARTGVSPWKEESIRLVCYRLVLENRYNQIAPFVESILNIAEIMQDPEIFSYYSLGLWLDKNYKQLQKLLKFPTAFRSTLRNRVSIGQAKFNYSMWNSLLAILTAGTNHNAEKILLQLFLNHSNNYTNSELAIYLERIPNFSLSSLSQDTQKLLTLRTSTLSNDEQFKIFESLSPHFFNYTWIILDFLSVAKNMKRSNRNKVSAILKKALTIAPDITVPNTIVSGIQYIALAELSYQNTNYASSISLYQKGFMSINDDKYIDILGLRNIFNKAKWRYLYSLIQKKDAKFFPAFFSISKKSQTPEYYSNLMEEYLSFLLQKNRFKHIEQQYNTYKDKVVAPSQKIELLRWESILSRINKQYSPDIAHINTATQYFSDTPFDYLVNSPSPTSIKSFLTSWESSPPSSEIVNSTDTIIQGFLDYGIISYGYNVAIENIEHIHTSTLYMLAEKLHHQGTTSQALTLLRRMATIDNNILEHKNSFLLLYPTPYLDILEKITDSPLEKALVMGLIREESSFNHNIRSPAGAIGLMQLLNTTAKELASDLEYTPQFDLTNPHDNIYLGYHYLVYLITVLKSPLKAIASYNGGLGNMWKWEKQYSTKNPIVFADSIPFRETRNYIRKVASSAMMYGLLYFDITPKVFQEFLFQEF